MTEAAHLSRAETTRARLLDAAVAAFSEKGFHGTTTRDIAAAAGMSPAALYVHHKSKEELLYLICKSGHEETLASIHEAMARGEGPVETLRRAAHDFALRHARTHTSARIVNYELAALAPDHLAEIRGIRRQIDDATRTLVRRGVDAGVFDIADQRITAAALLSLGIDLARWYHEGTRWAPEDIARQYADIALRIVGVL